MSEVKPVENGMATDHDDDFKRVVQESRERIHKEVGSEPVPIKRRGRGRPRKVGSEAAPQPAAAAEAKKPEVMQPPPDISQFLEMPLIALSKIPASRHKIPELALDAQEAKACAQSLNALMAAFVPNIGEMSPRTAAVISTCATFGTIAFSKYQIYLEKRVVEPPAEELPPENLPEGQIFPTQSVSAMDAFRRPGQ